MYPSTGSATTIATTKSGSDKLHAMARFQLLDEILHVFPDELLC
jgi:hypothetical protein